MPPALVARAGARYLTIVCPWHHDRHPSCLVYADGARCLSCGTYRGPVGLYMALHGVDHATALAAIRAGNFPRVAVAPRTLATPPQDLGRRLHNNLTDAAMEYYVAERGLHPDTIAHYQLGWGALYAGGPEGYTIPVYRDGKLRQVKQRLPGLAKNKYRSVADCGAWLYLGEDLAWRDTVCITEGEFDALVLRQAGYHAASPTGGVAHFNPAWRADLEGTTPYYAGDGDERGEEGYRRLRRLLGGRLKRVRWPAGIKDATEFFLRHDEAAFAALLTAADERYALGG